MIREFLCELYSNYMRMRKFYSPQIRMLIPMGYYGEVT